MGKIEISQDFFRKILLEKLKIVDEKLRRADDATYSKDELHDVWDDIRQSNLILEEIIDALE
jgi:uncharacterized protein (UPF0218 family)